MQHHVEAEVAGGSLNGDFTYHRYKGDFRIYVSPSPSHLFKTRVQAGTAGRDEVLPLQKTFALGGVGTLRALPFRHLRGNRMFLWNADWAWEVMRRSSRNAAVKTGLSLVVFSDLGLAWDAPTWDASRRQMAWNVGLGAGTTDETFRVYAARDVRSERAPLHFTVRISRAY
jgi:outer membrane protein assembly factor BamA